MALQISSTLLSTMGRMDLQAAAGGPWYFAKVRGIQPSIAYLDGVRGAEALQIQRE